MKETAHTTGFGRRLVAFALFALCMFTALTITSTSQAAIETPPPPQVWSDKADYAPGEQVTLSGANWGAGETVHIRVNDDAGETWRRDVDVTADEGGAISDQFNLPNWFVAQYNVTATGASSGTATWSFTDSNPQTITVTPSSVSVAQGSTASYTVSLSVGGNTNQCNITLAASGLPAGATATFGTNPLVTTGSGSSPVTTTLNVATSTTTPTGSFTINVSGTNSGAGCQGPGATSGSATLVVTPGCTATAITSQPVNQSVTYGANAAFSAAANGNPAPTVQWQVDSGSGFTNLSGATSTTLTLTKPSVSMSGNKYRAVFTNNCGGPQTATSNAATLTVNARSITITPNSGQSKVYGESDPALSYTSSPALETGDSFTGALERAAGENVGSYAINLGTLTAVPNYALSLSATTVNFAIAKRSVTASISAEDKTYDGTDDATISDCSLEAETGNHGVVSPDDVDCSATNAHFENANAGEDKAVTADVALVGGDKDNYQLTSATASTTATIEKADSTTTVTCPTSVTYNGAAQEPCSASVTGAGGLDQPLTVNHSNHTNAGTASASASYAGDTNHNGSNDSETFEIAKADLDLYAVGDSKEYDATTASNGVPLVDGLKGTDTVTGLAQRFQSKNVLGSGNSTLEIAPGYTVDDGNSGGNYDVHEHTASGMITKAPLDISAVSDTKVYDGNQDSSGVPSVSGLKGSDTVTGKEQKFQSKNVMGTNGSTLEVTAYTVDDGNSGGNYDVTTHTATGTITKKNLTVSGITASNKVWDGNTNATLNVSGASLVGVVSGDSVVLNTGAAVGTFASGNVGTWNVAVSGLTISGADGGNYSLTQPTTTASITAWNAAGYGFYQPVGVANSIFTPAPGTAPTTKPLTVDWVTAKGGSTVPLKFNIFAGSVERTSLAGTFGATPFETKKLASCTDSLSEDPADFTTTGSTTLRYDTTGMQWIQNWQTPKVSGDTCYRAWATFADGSTLEAFFKLKK